MNELKTLQAHPLVEQDWAQVLAKLPEPNLDSLARRTKALQRRRAVRSAVDLLRIVLAYAVCDWPLRLVGLWATLRGLAELSDVAVLKRLRACQRWLGQLVVIWLQHRQVRLDQRPVRLRIIDATVISRPGSSGTDWRLHLSFDLGQLCLDGIELTDGRSGETLVRHAAQPGDILLADRGYAHPRGLGAVLVAQAQLVVRARWDTLPLTDMEGQPFDLVGWLQYGPATLGPTECNVQLQTSQGNFALRLVACLLPPEAAAAARRRLRRANSRKQRTPSQRSLLMAGFFVVLTNLPTELWNTQQVLQLYRLRWQIELLCKRLKSILRFDALRAQDPALAQVYLLGKVLAALMIDEMVHQAQLRYPEWFLSVDHPLCLWRLFRLLAEGLCQAVRGVITLEQIQTALPKLKRYLLNTPRKRRQQCMMALNVLQTLVANCEIRYAAGYSHPAIDTS